MIAYIVCVAHKKAFNFIEVLEVIIDDEPKAIEVRDEYNKTRPAYSKVVIKPKEVKK